MAEQDYCQYIISKCAAKVCAPVTDGVFQTTKAFWESYENSSSFSVSARARDNRIIEWLSELLLACKILHGILFLKRKYSMANLLKSRDAKPEGAKVRKFDQVSRLPLYPYHI